MSGHWFEHDGQGCPVPAGTMLLVIWEDDPGVFVTGGPGRCMPDEKDWDWRFWQTPTGRGTLWARIVRYQVLGSRGAELLKRIAAEPGSLPEPEERVA